jgi:DTW domain-containing protein
MNRIIGQYMAVSITSLVLLSRNAHSFRIVLLTHINEQLRPTNTGQLLLTKTPVTVKSSHPGSSVVVTWEGRGDNEKISEVVRSLEQPILIWTDAPKRVRDSESGVLSSAGPTYIILDGTWQEAKKMFRYGPEELRSIPRMRLEPTFKSKYKLRGNFGYVNRFTPTNASVTGDDSSSSCEQPESGLLCTAEVCASLLIKHGHAESANLLLDRLEDFQMSFQSYSTSKQADKILE